MLTKNERTSIVTEGELLRAGFYVQIVMTILPSEDQITLLHELGEKLDSIEFVVSEEKIREQHAAISTLAATFPTSAFILSKLRSPADAQTDGLNYGHLVFHGWVPQEAPRFNALKQELFSHLENLEALYRVRFIESPIEMAQRVVDAYQHTGCSGALLLRLATDNPAQEQGDENALRGYVAETAIAAAMFPRLRITIDSLIDFDRGYFLRRGLFDRSFNPRDSVVLFRTLSVFLGGQNISLVNRNVRPGVVSVTLESEHDRFTVTWGTNEEELQALNGSDHPTETWNLLNGQQLAVGKHTSTDSGFFARLDRTALIPETAVN